MAGEIFVTEPLTFSVYFHYHLQMPTCINASFTCFHFYHFV